MLIVVVALLLGAALGDSPWPPSAQQRARALVAPIPVDMLLNMTHGLATGGAWQGTISGLPKYGVPSQHHHDSPQGVAGGFVQVTAFPTAMTVTMTWDVSLARQFGDAMGMEERAKGTSVQLAPAVNHARIPWGGRLFEYLGGEDPTLATALAVQVLLGIQSHNISACVKHYILNEQARSHALISAGVPARPIVIKAFPRRTHNTRYSAGYIITPSFHLVNYLIWRTGNLSNERQQQRGPPYCNGALHAAV